MPSRARFILWLDGGAALSAGLSVLVLREWLAHLHRFEVGFVTFLGVVNLCYGAYSSSLALRRTALRRRALDVLVFANAAWAAICVDIVVSRWSSASAFGLVHVAFEGAFVAALAYAEYRVVRPQLSDG